MDARALDDVPLAVEQETVRTPLDLANTERLGYHIIGKADAAGVQVWRFRCPEAGVIKGQGKYGLAVALLLHGGQVVHRQAYRAGGGGLYAHLHDGGVKRPGADFNAVQRDIRALCRPKLHRAVDARAGIPPAVGLVGVAGNDTQLVLTCVQIRRTINIKVGVAVGAERSLLTVEPDLGIMVDTLKLQNVGVCQLVFRHGQGALVFVVISLVPAGIGAARAYSGAGFGQHGIMGQGHRFAGCGIAQMAARPAGEKGCCFHTRSSLSRLSIAKNAGDFPFLLSALYHNIQQKGDSLRQPLFLQRKRYALLSFLTIECRCALCRLLKAKNSPPKWAVRVISA